MQRWWQSARVGCAAMMSAGALILAMPLAAPAAPLCDEYDPAGPSRSAQIRLDSTDFVDEDGTEIRSFIETGSLGRVDVRIVSATPRGIVHGVSAVPEISALSPYHSERLKGIHVGVQLATTKQPVNIVLDLRQVCARHFRNTFLYY